MVDGCCRKIFLKVRPELSAPVRLFQDPHCLTLNLARPFPIHTESLPRLLQCQSVPISEPESSGQVSRQSIHNKPDLPLHAFLINLSDRVLLHVLTRWNCIAYADISVHTLYRLVKASYLPHLSRFPNLVYLLPADIQESAQFPLGGITAIFLPILPHNLLVLPDFITCVK